MKIQVGSAAPITVGVTEISPTVSITDYSKRVTDDFGVTTVVKRGFARRLSVRIAVPSDEADDLQRQFIAVRAKVATWIADERYRWLQPEGIYRDFAIDFTSSGISYCTLSVEGVAETETVADTGVDPAPQGTSTFLLLRPIEVDDSRLLDSNVAEADAPEWNAITSYAKTERVRRAHRVYESLVAANAGHDPIGAGGQWLDLAPTNRWAMFDQALGTKTETSGSISATFSPSGIRAVGLLDVTGATVRVQAYNSNSGTPRYDRTLKTGKDTLTFLDIPAVTGRVKVTISGAGTVSVGTLLVGDVVGLGVTETSPTAAITDFSKKEVDDFGEVTIVERSWARRMDARALIASSAIDTVADRIAAVRAQPCLWLGKSGQDILSIYGFFKDFSIEVGQATSKLSLSIEGLSKAAPVTPLKAITDWPDVGDPTGTKPQDNATVGAPPGTNVGGVPAEQVVERLSSVGDRLNALDTQTIPAINDAVADANSAIAAARDAANLGLASANTRLDGVRDDLAAEVARAQGEDETINSRIDAIVAEGGYDDTEVRTLIQTAQTARADGDSALGQRIDTVITDYKAADTSTNTRISTVETAYADGDQALGQRIDTVTTNYQAADTATNTRITSEATASSDRDTALGQRIDSIVAEGGYDDTNVRAEISRVETASVTRDNALGQRIDTTSTNFGNALNAKAQEITTAFTNADTALATRASSLEASSAAATGTLNPNPDFSAWSNPAAEPDNWTYWGLVDPLGRVANPLSRGGFAVDHTPQGINSGLVRGSIFVGNGFYVMEATVWRLSGSWNGAGVTLNGQNSIDFMSAADSAGRVGDVNGDGGVRSWSWLLEVRDDYIGPGYKNFHLMGNWEGFGRGFSPKTLRWLRCAIRPASEAEIKALRADAALNSPGGVIARVSAAETALTDGRFATAQRAANIEASVGNVSARVSNTETAVSDGRFAASSTVQQLRSEYNGTAATVTQQAGAIAGIGQKTAAYVKIVADAGGGRAALSLWSDQFGGAWTLTGDGLIDGNLTINGTVTIHKLDRSTMTSMSADSDNSTFNFLSPPGAGATAMFPGLGATMLIGPGGTVFVEFSGIQNGAGGTLEIVFFNAGTGGELYSVGITPGGNQQSVTQKLVRFFNSQGAALNVSWGLRARTSDNGDRIGCYGVLVRVNWSML